MIFGKSDPPGAWELNTSLATQFKGLHLINDNGTMRYSATDITRWLSCAHASRLDALLPTDQELKAWKATHPVRLTMTPPALMPPFAVTNTNSRCFKA